MRRFLSMFENQQAGREVSAARSGSQESLKLTKAEQELRKCLGNDTEERLLKGYSCSWQREILVQGHLYITSNWICFYSNILGWESKTSICCHDITSITKEKTAKVFPNAILIVAGDKKYGFSSFLHRNKSYQVIVKVWENSLSDHPLSPEALSEELMLIKNKDSLVLKHKSKAPLTLPSTSDHTSDDIDSPMWPRSSSFTLSPTTSPYPPRQNSPILLRHSTDLSTSSTTGTEAAQDSEDFTTLDINHCSYGSATDSDESTYSRVMERDILMTPVEHKEDRGSNSDSSVSSGELVRSPSLIALWAAESGDDDEDSAEERRMKEESDPSCTQNAKLIHQLWTQVKPTVVHKLQGTWLYRIRATPNLFNIFILFLILIMLVSTFILVCKISHMEPLLQPYLAWQPWCRLCSTPQIDSTNQPLTEGGQATVLTRAIFEQMVTTHLGLDPESSYSSKHKNSKVS